MKKLYENILVLIEIILFVTANLLLSSTISPYRSENMTFLIQYDTARSHCVVFSSRNALYRGDISQFAPSRRRMQDAGKRTGNAKLGVTGAVRPFISSAWRVTSSLRADPAGLGWSTATQGDAEVGSKHPERTPLTAQGIVASDWTLSKPKAHPDG
jgi:hypothetical protein